jgi:hypothetical protein
MYPGGSGPPDWQAGVAGEDGGKTPPPNPAGDRRHGHFTGVRRATPVSSAACTTALATASTTWRLKTPGMM